MIFSHERLTVYQRAIQFIAWTQPILESLPARLSARDQLERASTSIPLNIAEGNAKASAKDRARFWQIALGSSVECAAVLDVLVARGVKTPEEVGEGKGLLAEIVRMLMALLSQLGTRVAEEAPEYGILDGDEDGEGDEDGDEDEDEDEEGDSHAGGRSLERPEATR